jgi:hypothetical protein
LAGIIAIFLIVMWGRQITGAPIVNDGAQSLQMAINLARHGTISMESQPPLSPTNYREPLLPCVTAAIVSLTDKFGGVADAQSYFSGPLAQRIKYQNVIWLALFCAATFWITRALTSSFWAGLLAVVIVSIPFRPHNSLGLVDALLNEVPSLCFLVAASVALAVTRKDRRLFLLSGLLFGLLALLKAVAFYVFLVIVAGLTCWTLLRRRRYTAGISLNDLLLAVVAFGCVVGPWMYRNHLQLGTFAITQRAGESVRERSFEDSMSRTEMLGAIYLWAPIGQQRLGNWLGFSQVDLQRGGKLQRLNDDPDSPLSQADLAFERIGQPAGTVTFYRRARAEREQLQHELEIGQAPHPDVQAERMQEALALGVFLHHPWRHTIVSALFLWRGGARTTLILALVLAVAIRKQRYDLALFAVPTVVITATYAFLTPFFPRYDVPQRLTALIALFIVVVLVLEPLRPIAKYSNPSSRINAGS